MPSRVTLRRHLIARFPQEEQGGGVFFVGPGGLSIVSSQDPLQPQGVTPQSQVQNGPSSSPVPLIQQPPTPQPGTSSVAGVMQSLSPASQSPTTTVIFTDIPLSTSPPSTESPPAAPVPSTTVAVSALPATETPITTPSTTVSDALTSSSLSLIASAATLTAPSETTIPSSSSSDHNPILYIGISLGTIVIVACIATLAAWFIRLRAHRKRRREFAGAYVPWGKPDDNEMEEAKGAHFFGGGSFSTSWMTSSDKGIESWEPIGDRDVGLPKRANGSRRIPLSPTERPTVDPFADNYLSPGTTCAQFPILAESVTYPLPPANRPYPLTRPFPPHIESDDFSVKDSTRTLGPLQVANLVPGDLSLSRPGTVMSLTRSGNSSELGTPREQIPGSRPRFWGLEGNGLKVPWVQPHLRSPSYKTDSENARSVNDSAFRSRPSTPGQAGEQLGCTSSEIRNDGWTASLKSNLVNAFNAVASNLNIKSAADDDRLTPAPLRKAHRPTLRGTGWGEHVNETLVVKSLTRESTTHSMISQLSKAWTLEETGDGVGVVHIRGDHLRSPKIAPDMITQDDNECNMNRSTTPLQSQTPLIITKKPPAALLKGSNRLHPGVLGGLSRASSVYSTASAASSMFAFGERRSRPPRLPSFSSFPRAITARSREGKTTDVEYN